MTKSSIALATALIFAAGSAFAFHCPQDMKKIDDALAKNPKLDATLAARDADEAGARGVVQAIALAVAAAELLRHAPSSVSDAYCASRLAPATYTGAAFGTVRDAGAAAKILARALPG